MKSPCRSCPNENLDKSLCADDCAPLAELQGDILGGVENRMEVYVVRKDRATETQKVSLKTCPSDTVDLPGDPGETTPIKTAICAFSQTDPYETEEPMDIVAKINSPAQALETPRKEKGRLYSQFLDLPLGADWTGTKCGHTGQKGTEFYVSNPRYCKKCLYAQKPKRSVPITCETGTHTEAQEESLPIETQVDASETEVQLEGQNTASGGQNMESRRIVVCGNCGEEKPHHAHGLCRQCDQDQRVSATVGVNFRSRPELLEKIRELAEDQERTVIAQIIYMLKRQVGAGSMESK